MSSTDSPAQALAAQLINQTLSSVALLESLSIINASDTDLPSSLGTMTVVANPQPSRSPPSASSVPILPRRGNATEARARALWDYHGTEGDDLSFKAGDTIVIDEEVNEQWYRGRVIPKGATYPLELPGLFPSNYVEKRRDHPQSPPSFSSPSAAPQAVARFQAPVLQQSSYNEKPPVQRGQVVPTSPPVMLADGLIPDPGQAERKAKFDQIGNKLQNSVIHGAGFSIGAKVVNKIF